MVSISLFFLILIFLYKTLDVTKKSNDFFDKKVTKVITDANIKKIFIEDIVEASSLEFNMDKNSNFVVQIETTNMYHNVFYKYVTYFVSNKNNLLRIESLKKFDKANLTDDFFKYSFIDIVIKDVEIFEISQLKQNENAYSVMYKIKNEQPIVFGTIKF